MTEHRCVMYVRDGRRFPAGDGLQPGIKPNPLTCHKPPLNSGAMAPRKVVMNDDTTLLAHRLWWLRAIWIESSPEDAGEVHAGGDSFGEGQGRRGAGGWR